MNDWYCPGCNFKIFGSKDKCFKCNIYRKDINVKKTDLKTNFVYHENYPNQIVSLNVLHIIHEINHNNDKSPVLNEYRNKESYRITRLYDLIVSFSVNSVVCLQEVSGDLYKLLSQHEDFTCFQYVYPRVPLLKKGLDELCYQNGYECLLTLVPNFLNVNSVRYVQSRDDKGKAALIIECNGLTLVNIHFPFNTESRNRLIMDINQQVHDKPCIIIGDFNVGPEIVEQEFKKINDNFYCLDIQGITCKPNKKLDHVVTNITKFNHETFIKDTETLSDHNLIGVEVFI